MLVTTTDAKQIGTSIRNMGLFRFFRSGCARYVRVSLPDWQYNQIPIPTPKVRTAVSVGDAWRSAPMLTIMRSSMEKIVPISRSTRATDRTSAPSSARQPNSSTLDMFSAVSVIQDRVAAYVPVPAATQRTANRTITRSTSLHPTKTNPEPPKP